MRALRIRWQGVAKVAGAAVGVVVAFATLPGLLRAPEPPPLGKDVGLPRVRDGAFSVQETDKAPKRERHRHRQAARRHRPEGSRSKAPHAHKPPDQPAPDPPPPAPEPLPTPEPAPEPVAPPSPPPTSPPPPPPPVEDGSAEFAPH